MARSKPLLQKQSTRDGQGKDHDEAYDVVAASMTERVDGQPPRLLLAAACIRAIVQLRMAGLSLQAYEGATILKTLAQRLMGRAWIEKEVVRLMRERIEGSTVRTKKPPGEKRVVPRKKAPKKVSGRKK